MDYNKLSTFKTVCEAGGFTKAGLKLRRSQSAISQQIQFLEEKLSLTLILRKKSGIQLTSEGSTLLNVLKSSLSAIDDVIHLLTNISTIISSEVRIGVLADFGSEHATSIVAKLKGSFPNVGLRFVFKNNSQEIEQALEQEELDFGVVVFVKSPRRYRIHRLYEIEHVLAASSLYLRQNQIRNIKDLINAQLIDFTNDFTSMAYFVALCEPKMLRALRSKKPIAVVPNHTAIRQLVKSGVGVGLLQLRFCAKDFTSKQLVEVLPQKAHALMVPINLVYKSSRRLKNFESKVVELLRAEKTNSDHRRLPLR